MARVRLSMKLGHRVIVPLAVKVLNLWFSTCRVHILNPELYRKFIFSDKKVVGATWHRGAIFLVWFFRNAHPMIMFSRSNDGALLADFAERLGIVPIGGSSKHGGREALAGMLAWMKQPGSRKAATVLDGPRGPACIAKKGMLVLASQARVPLVPLMMSASPALTIKRSWDRTLVPLPFSRVVVSFAEPVNIPASLNSEELEQFRVEVESTLNRMRDSTDAMTGYNDG